MLYALHETAILQCSGDPEFPTIIFVSQCMLIVFFISFKIWFSHFYKYVAEWSKALPMFTQATPNVPGSNPYQVS